MIATLVWKEYREQRSTWLIMAVLATAAIVTLAVLVNPVVLGLPPGSPAFVALTIAAMYGVVCGALMLAGEREGRTGAFLTSVARTKTDLWRTKALTGAGLSAAQGTVTAFVLMGVWLRTGEATGFTWSSALGLLVVAAVAPMLGFAWGMLFSTVCRTALAAIGLAAVPVVSLWAVGLFLCGLTRDGVFACLFMQSIAAALALHASWWMYARDDAAQSSSGIAVPRQHDLLWSTVRLGRSMIFVLAALAVAAGCLLPWYGPPLWPSFTLIVALICGLAVFAPRQMADAEQVYAEDGVRLGWIWAIKVAVWVVVAVIAAVIGLVVAGAIVQWRRRWSDTGSRMLAWDLAERPMHLLRTIMLESDDKMRYDYLLNLQSIFMGPAYAFAVGLVSNLIARKQLVAVLVSLPLTLALLCWWIPSWFAGGLASWQLYGVPVLLLAWSLLFLRMRMDESRFRVHRLSGVAACGISVAAWTGANLWYRVSQIPNVGQPFDVPTYLAEQPSATNNRAGDLLEALQQELPEWKEVVRQKVGPLTRPPYPAVGEYENGGSERGWYDYTSQANDVLLEGWPAKPGKFGDWLEQMCAGPWARDAREIAHLPVGVVRLPMLGGWLEPRMRYIDWEVGAILGAHALQLQAAGDDTGALDVIASELAISRTISNHAVTTQFLAGHWVEYHALTALLTWARKPGIARGQLARALREVLRHEAESPSAVDASKADYLAEVRRIDDPDRGLDPEMARDLGPVSTKLAVLTAKTPWERARFLRLVNSYFKQEIAAVAADPTEAADIRLPDGQISDPLSYLFWSLRPGTHEREHRSIIRRCETVLALLLYREQYGRVPQTLADLAPEFLSAVPFHPFTDPFTYRVSRPGEIVSVTNSPHWVQGNLEEERVKKTLAGGIGILEWQDREGRHTWLVPSSRQ